jgi:hypothetical protein
MNLEQELQEQVRLSWEAQALLTDILWTFTSESTLDEIDQRSGAFVLRLRRLIGDPEILVLLDSAVGGERISGLAKSGTTAGQGVEFLRLGDGLAREIDAHQGEDYLEIKSGSSASTFLATFSDAGNAVECFPVWRGSKNTRPLIGAMVFSSRNSLVNNPQMQLIKTVARSVVNLSILSPSETFRHK